jgi:hypothetical protein
MRKAISIKEVIVWISLGSADIRVGKLWFHVSSLVETNPYYGNHLCSHDDNHGFQEQNKLSFG